jgi:hypothetical protein
MPIEPFRETVTCYSEAGDGDTLEIAQGFDGTEAYVEVAGRRIAVYRGNGKAGRSRVVRNRGRLRSASTGSACRAPRNHKPSR